MSCKYFLAFHVLAFILFIHSIITFNKYDNIKLCIDRPKRGYVLYAIEEFEFCLSAIYILL